MTRAARPRRGRQHAMAARQALRLCEADLLRLAWDTAGPPQYSRGIRRGQPSIGAGTAREALRAVGVPPHTAAILRSRLRLTPEPEDTP
jgi:hypothetical protein